MAYVRTEGWRLASNGGRTLAEIRACYELYCEEFKNQNYLAKMHPALVPIESDDPSVATLQQVDDMIVQVNREKGLGEYYPDYVQSDVELVDHIGEIVSGVWCGPEGMQIAGTLAKERHVCDLQPGGYTQISGRTKKLLNSNHPEHIIETRSGQKRPYVEG